MLDLQTRIRIIKESIEEGYFGDDATNDALMDLQALIYAFEKSTINLVVYNKLYDKIEIIIGNKYIQYDNDVYVFWPVCTQDDWATYYLSYETFKKDYIIIGEL